MFLPFMIPQGASDKGFQEFKKGNAIDDRKSAKEIK